MITLESYVSSRSDLPGWLGVDYQTGRRGRLLSPQRHEISLGCAKAV